MVVLVIAGAREHPPQPSWSTGVAFEHKPARISIALLTTWRRTRRLGCTSHEIVNDQR